MRERRDGFMAMGLGMLAFCWYLVFAPSGIPPEMWHEMTVAASLRAPLAVFPGLARYLTMTVCDGFGFGAGTSLTVLLGRVLAALSVALVFLLLRYILKCAATPLEIATPKRRLAGDVICATVTVMFAFSSAMLETSEALSVDSLAMFLSLASLCLFFRFLDRGGIAVGGTMLVLFGIVTAETPSGFLLVAVAAVLYLLSIRGLTGFVPRPPSVYVREVFKWWATLAFALGFFGTVALNLALFEKLGGLEASGIDFLTLVLRYATRYGEVCAATATGAGWFLVFGVVVFTFVFALALLPMAKDEEKFLVWRIGVAYVFLAAVSAAQLGSISSLWFRSWSSEPGIHSHYLVGLCSFLSAVSLTISLAVIAIEAFFRNHLRILRFKAGENPELGSGDFAAIRRRRIAMAVIVPLALIAFSLPFGHYHVRREMRRMLDEAVAEIVREAGEAKYLFTDGVLDNAIELASVALNDRRIYPLTMFGDEGEYARYLRLRGGFTGEDAHLMKISAASAYHDWVMHSPERLAESAFMLGFEMWRATGKTEPAASGYLARTAYAEGERERGVAAAREMAERVIAFCREHSAAKRAAAGTMLNRFFSVMMWRLSRLCVLRADALGRAGDRAGSEAERALSAELDAENPYFAGIDGIRQSMAGRPRQEVSPREKLKLALMRADFENAAVHARLVLESDPGNVDARFALGMRDFFAKRYDAAEVNLARALDSKPRDGVLWNNLAMCQLRQGKLAEAEKSALEAVKLLPRSTAASNTLLEIRKEREERK